MQFIRRIMISLLVAPGFFAGCNSDPCANGVSVTIEENHPDGDHILEVTSADVNDATDVTYDIQGDNTGHGHTVTLTSDDFDALDSGDVVTLESGDTGAAGQDHTHVIILECNL